MAKLILLTLCAIQVAVCTTRDQRHVPAKFEFDKKAIASTLNGIDAIDPNNPLEAESLLAAAEDFRANVREPLRLAGLGIKNNSRDNESGKKLAELVSHGAGYVQWVQDNVKGDFQNVRANLRAAVNNFLPFISAADDALAHAKESAADSGLAINALIDAIDDGGFLFNKVNEHLKHGKDSIAQIHVGVRDASSAALSALSRISPEQYYTRELVIHGRQYRSVLDRLIIRLNTWLKAATKEDDLRTTVERTVEKLKAIEDEVKRKVVSKASSATLKKVYKNSLSDVFALGNVFEKSTRGYGNLQRAFSIDLLAIATYYKINFEILNG